MYDKEEIFEEKVKPAFQPVHDLLVANDIPFWFTAAVKNGENETVYKTISCSALSMGIDDLYEDRFKDYMKICAGWKVCPIQKNISAEADDIFNEIDDLDDIGEIFGDDD